MDTLKKYNKISFILVITILSIVILSGCDNNTYPTQQSSNANSIAPLQNSVSSPAPVDNSCGVGYYKNVDGNCIHSPGNDPQGASARCQDGSYSYSQHRRGTCSSHGGVEEWL